MRSLLESLPAGGVPAAIALVAGVAALLALALLLRRRRARRAAGRPERVRSLARQGLDASEIARRTGLSRDAVALTLRLAPGEPGARDAGADFAAALRDATREHAAPATRTAPRQGAVLNLGTGLSARRVA